MRPATSALLTASATASVLAAVPLAAAAGRTGEAVAALACGGAVAVGWVVVARRPGSPVGPAVAWTSGSAALVEVVAALAAGGAGGRAASLARPLENGVWPLNLAGLLALLLVFPDGRLRGGRWHRVWASVPWLFGAATVGVLVLLWGSGRVDGQVVSDPGPVRTSVGLVSVLLLGAAMLLAVASLAVRYRRGSELVRQQLRWLLLAGAVVVVLLFGGWAGEAAGASLAVAYTPFLAAVVLLVPLAVGVAVVRHDLLDVDRVLSEGAAWALTLLASAAVFGAVVLGAAQVVQRSTAVGPTAAAFLTALVLLPLHRWVSGALARVVDRDRFVAVAAVQRFTEQVHAGERQAEEVEDVLRAAHGEPLRLLLARPGAPGWTDLRGAPAEDGGDPDDVVTLTARGEVVAKVELTGATRRSRRRAAALAHAAWVPIEVSRLRLGLRSAQARLADAAAGERRRLERDLHDGAQQRILATGMRLRSLQRRLQRGPDAGYAAEVDRAVDELEATVAELRRLAHGVRPARLDDGLAAALEQVSAASPIPVLLSVEDAVDGDHGDDETRRLTAYLVVAEAVANVLKHARATRIDVQVSARGGAMVVRVADDGVGGVPSAASLTALGDRVTAVGGVLRVESPAGRGTVVTAQL